MPMELLSLSDDMLANVAQKLLHAKDQCRFFRSCTRARAVSARVTDLLLGWNGQSAVSFDESAKMSQLARCLAPTSWSARLVNLKHLTLCNMTAGGVSRVIGMHLRSWPRLQILLIQAPFAARQMEELVQDIALSLRNDFLRLPELRHLDLEVQGQPYFGPDASLVAALPPTARLWWMAERPQHVRCRKLDLWRTTAAQSDLLWQEHGTFTILSFLAHQIAFCEHSRRGYREVRDLLLSQGASAKRMKTPYFKFNHSSCPPLSPTEIYNYLMAEEEQMLSRGVVDGLAANSDWSGDEDC